MNTKEQTFTIKQFDTCSKSFPTVKFEMPESSSLDDVIEAFEAFLIGVTFELPKGARLGLVYDEETERQKLEEKYGKDEDKIDSGKEYQTLAGTTPDGGGWSISHPVWSESFTYPTTQTLTTSTPITPAPAKAAKKKKSKKKKNK
jgi:hypothetical protein